MLQAYAGYDVVIAGSFLLTDAVVEIARANPATHFVLVDPLVSPPDVPNLAVLTFRSDQAAFLAGALAGILTGNGVVAGIYGPAGAIDQANRLGFERGARFVQIWSGNDNGFPRRNWDSHEDVRRDHGPLARGFARGASALIQDLKQRGLLDDTVILWTTEFGRMPSSQG